MSPCHHFRPFHCTSLLRFVVFSPHSSLLASAVTAVVLGVLLLFFSVPRPFRSAFRASRCYLCFIVQQSQKACYMSNSSTNGMDIAKTWTGKIKAGDFVVEAWDNPPPPPLLLQAAVDRHHRQHPRHEKKTSRSSEPPTSKSRPSRPRPSRTPSRTSKVRRILLFLLNLKDYISATAT